MTKEEVARDYYEAKWIEAQSTWGCNCPSGNPPCGFCTEGFGLCLDEYVELNMEQFKQPTDTVTDDFDRAMRGI